MNSKIYIGSIQHRRFTPKRHCFKYKVFMMCLELSELHTVFSKRWLWSINRFNIASFQRKYYLGNHNTSLLESVKELINNETGCQIQQVYLITNLSYFGYCFNPISFYFCLNNEALTHCIAEVSNTPWGESHAYILSPKKIQHNIYEMHVNKAMHVSPFLKMNYQYKFLCKYDQENIILHIQNLHNNKRHFDATLKLHAKDINGRNLAKTLIRFPFMTGRVILAIYWQALKLWSKGIPIIQHIQKNT